MAAYGQTTVVIDPNQTAQDQVTFPGAPPGYNAISLWGYPELATLGPDVSSVDFSVIVPFQTDIAQWSVWMDDLKNALATSGYTLVAYEVDQETILQVTIPTQIDISTPVGNGTFTVPSQICVPGTSLCVSVAGQTILNVYSYRIWLMVETPAGAGQYAAHVRGQVWPLILVIIAGLPIIVPAVASLYGMLTGKMTPQQVADVTSKTGLGQNIVPAEQSIVIPLVLLGVLSIGASIVIAVTTHQPPPPSPPAAVYGGVTGPGGVGASGGVTYGYAPKAQEKGANAGRRRS